MGASHRRSSRLHASRCLDVRASSDSRSRRRRLCRCVLRVQSHPLVPFARRSRARRRDRRVVRRRHSRHFGGTRRIRVLGRSLARSLARDGADCVVDRKRPYGESFAWPPSKYRASADFSCLRARTAFRRTARCCGRTRRPTSIFSRAPMSPARAFDPRIRSNVNVVVRRRASRESRSRRATVASCADRRPLVMLGVQCVAHRQSVKCNGFYGRRRPDEHRLLPSRRDTPESIAREAARIAMRQLRMRSRRPRGRWKSSSVPAAAVSCLHEAVGHGLEGDFNRQGTSLYSWAHRRAGRERTRDHLRRRRFAGRTRQRSPSTTRERPAQHKVLVERGVLRGYMHDKLNAGADGHGESTGSGRRQSFRVMPQPRMCNTYMPDGGSTYDEIVGSVKRGIFATSFAGGQVEISKGDFVFMLAEGYLIEDGKLTAPLRGASLIGNGPEAMNRVTMVGNDGRLAAPLLHVREGRSVRARRGRHADRQARERHRGRLGGWRAELEVARRRSGARAATRARAQAEATYSGKRIASAPKLVRQRDRQTRTLRRARNRRGARVRQVARKASLGTSDLDPEDGLRAFGPRKRSMRRASSLRIRAPVCRKRDVVRPGSVRRTRDSMRPTFARARPKTSSTDALELERIARTSRAFAAVVNSSGSRVADATVDPSPSPIRKGFAGTYRVVAGDPSRRRPIASDGRRQTHRARTGAAATVVREHSRAIAADRAQSGPARDRDRSESRKRPATMRCPVIFDRDVASARALRRFQRRSTRRTSRPATPFSRTEDGDEASAAIS